MTGFYDADLAWCHHVGFSDPALPPAVVTELRLAGIERGKVVDLGCNGGHLLRAFVDAGYEPVGIDVSAAAIELARETAPEADLYVGDAGACEVPDCAAITALGEVLCYAPDGGSGALSDDATLARFHDAMAPGGLLLFDILVADPANRFEYRTFREGENWAVLIDVNEDLKTARLRREITLFRRVDDAWRRSTETHMLVVHDADAVAARLRRAGFSVGTADAIGPVAMLPRRTVFICRKAAC